MSNNNVIPSYISYGLVITPPQSLTDETEEYHDNKHDNKTLYASNHNNINNLNESHQFKNKFTEEEIINDTFSEMIVETALERYLT